MEKIEKFKKRLGKRSPNSENTVILVACNQLTFY